VIGHQLWSSGDLSEIESFPEAEEAGMAQLDDDVGALLKHISDIGEENNTIVIFTTDNGAEVLTCGMTPFEATKGTSFEGGFGCWRSSGSRAR